MRSRSCWATRRPKPAGLPANRCSPTWRSTAPTGEAITSPNWPRRSPRPCAGRSDGSRRLKGARELARVLQTFDPATSGQDALRLCRRYDTVGETEELLLEV